MIMQNTLFDKARIEQILLNSSTTPAALAILTTEQADKHIWSGHLGTTMQLWKWDDRRIQEAQNSLHTSTNDNVPWNC